MFEEQKAIGRHKTHSLFRRISSAVDRFWRTKWYFISVFIVALAALASGQYAAGANVLGFITAFFLLFCPDILASVLPFGLIFLLAAPAYDDLRIFYSCSPAAAVIVLTLCIHFLLWHGYWHLGKCGRGLVLVSCATLLGGLNAFFERSVLQYYYILGCGVLSLLVYLIIASQIAEPKPYDLRKKTAAIFYAIGLFMLVVVAMCYIKTCLIGGKPFHIIDFNYRNYAATILLATCPMPIYFLKSNKWHGLVFFLFVIGLLFTGSRSALLFGVVEIILCAIYVAKFKFLPLKQLIISLVAVVALILAVFFWAEFEFIINRVPGGAFISTDDHRWQDIIASVKDFLASPIYGTGIGRTLHSEIPKEWIDGSIFVYQNAIAQIIGSMGLIGIVSYAVLFRDRVKMLFSHINPFSMIMALSYLGMLMISMTNPGIFNPFPNCALMVVLFAVVERVNENYDQDSYYSKVKIHKN